MNINIRRLLCAVSVVALVIAAGCESEKDDDSVISISPMSCKIKMHESRVFTASGGQNLRWTLKDPSLGTLSSTAGSTVTYVASSHSGDQILTVTGENAYGEEKSPANAVIQQVNPDEELNRSDSTGDNSSSSTQEKSSDTDTQEKPSDSAQE